MLLAMEYCGSQPDLKFVLSRHDACSNCQLFSGWNKSRGKSCRPWTCARIQSSRPSWRTGTLGLVIPYHMELDTRLMLNASRSLIGLVAHSLGDRPWLVLVHIVEVKVAIHQGPACSHWAPWSSQSLVRPSGWAIEFYSEMPGNVFSHSDVARTNPVNISKICLDHQHVSLQRLAVLVKFGELRDLRICSDKDVGISVRGRNMQPPHYNGSTRRM